MITFLVTKPTLSVIDLRSVLGNYITWFSHLQERTKNHVTPLWCDLGILQLAEVQQLDVAWTQVVVSRHVQTFFAIAVNDNVVVVGAGSWARIRSHLTMLQEVYVVGGGIACCQIMSSEVSTPLCRLHKHTEQLQFRRRFGSNKYKLKRRLHLLLLQKQLSYGQ